MKSLLKNSVYNIIYRCLNVVFPLVTSAWVSRIIMADGIGKVASAQNIVSYFTILAALGIPTYGTKVISAHNGNKEIQSKNFSELFVINAISTIICTIIYYTIILLVPFFNGKKILYAVCGLSIVFNIINVDWLYQGKEEFGYIMVRSVVVKFLSLIACLLFVRTKDDFIIYAVITTMVTVANYLFNIVHARKYVSFSLMDLDVKQHLKPVFILLAASIAIEIYTLADTTMLTFFYEDNIVGYYSNSIRIIRVIKTLVSAICAAFFPRISYYYSNNEIDKFNKLVNRAIKILFFVSVPATLGVILVSSDMIPILFGNDFNDSILTAQLLSISIITVAFSNFFGYQILITVGKEKQMMISTIIGAIINIVLNLILVVPFKYNGVAFASSFTELSVVLYQIYSIRKDIVFEKDKKFYISAVVCTFLMGISIVVWNILIDTLILRFTMAIFIGISVYFISMILTKNQIAMLFINKILKRSSDE